ncbi:MAG: peptide chain release factor N(5)-glutamine methyltransferase, partial [Armatimonadota bacterium]
MAQSRVTVLTRAAARLARAGVDSPVLDAQLLLARVLGCSRLDLIAHPEQALTAPEIERFETLLSRRLAREPLAYILGRKEFYGLEFEVAPGVLVPRPETEVLVQECARRLRTPFPTVLDVGTGSGVIAIALAIANPSALLYATDISPAALEVARANAAKHGVSERVNVLRCDLVESLAGMVFDAIVSNPPYVPAGQIDSLQPEIRLHEPVEALDGGPDG